MQCWTCSSLMSAPLPADRGIARGAWGHVPQVFRTYSHLCFERRYHKQNSVIRLKSNIFAPPTKFLGLPKFLGWLRYYLQGQVAKLVSGLFYYWSLSCNNNMATNIHFKLRYQTFCCVWLLNADILAGNVARQWLLIAASRDVGERWHWNEGQREQRCLFIGNFMIY